MELRREVEDPDSNIITKDKYLAILKSLGCPQSLPSDWNDEEAAGDVPSETRRLELHETLIKRLGDKPAVVVGILVSRSRCAAPDNFGRMVAAPRTTCAAGHRVTPVQVGLARRCRASKGPAARRRPRTRTGRLVTTLAAGVLLVAQCGGENDGGGSAGGDGAPAPTPEAAITPVAEAAHAPATTIAPPAPGPASPESPAPIDAAEPATPTAAEQEPPPALSGPPPVAVGTMPELRIDAGGPAHALFAAKFFSGPVDGFSVASSDTAVVTAGVSPPDMLIVAPVSRGSAGVTVTAAGPGGSATQTFTVRVGTAADRSQVAAPPAPAPSPAPPAATPPAPFVPEEELPAATPPAPFVPEEELPASTPPPGGSSPDDQPLYSLATETVTAPPALSSSIPAQTIIVGNSGTVNASLFFSGIVQGWAVESSVPASVPVSVGIDGIVSFSGDALGTSTITVTAANDAGRVAHGFTVSVKTAAQVVLTTVGGRPQLLVPVGQTVSVDLSRYFSEAATEFDVTYDRTDPNRLVDVTVQGSVASIRGVRGGTVRIILVAASATSRISRPATVRVAG